MARGIAWAVRPALARSRAPRRLAALAAVDSRGGQHDVLLATATASFDIFADDQPLQIEVQAMKRTRTRASIYLTCSQGERGVTSRLAAHFVIPK